MEILYYDKKSKNTMHLISDREIKIKNIEYDGNGLFTIYTNLGFYFILTKKEINKIRDFNRVINQ